MDAVLGKSEIQSKMEDVCDIYFTPLTESTYVRPFRFHYTQNGKQKNWDLLEVHDSVAVLLFNVTRRKVIFVKQFRPAVYFNSIDPEDRGQPAIDTTKYPPALGCTLEMCAGIVDKALPLDRIACEEVMEECGYSVTPSDLQRVMSYRSGVGVIGSIQTLYYCEVTDAMKCSDGGGVEDEVIEVVELSISETERLVSGAGPGAGPRDGPAAAPPPRACPPSALLAVMWFLHYKADKWRKSFELLCGECKRPDAEAAGPAVGVVTERPAHACPNPFDPPPYADFASAPPAPPAAK